jgi:rare lipoprotein A
MNKLITVFIVLLVSACSSNQTKTANAGIPASFAYREPVAPKLVVAAHSQTSPKVKVAPILEPKDPFLTENKPLANAAPKQLSNQEEESLFPRLVRYLKKGVASWYGPGFHGRKTATGEIFNMYEMTAAHKTLPIPSYAEVTNLENNKTVVVKINDRGPYVGNRLLDLSYAAAKKLGIQSEGTGKVAVKTISPLQALPYIQKAAESQHKKVYMQLGNFGSQKKALSLHRKIASNHLPSATVVASRGKQSTSYKVQLGPIQSAENAVQLSAQLARIGIKNPEFVADARQN